MYDLAIIGGGPGGYVAAERAGAAGLSVVLFEKRTLGGVCLNEGCIPTKTLLYSAKVYDYTRHADQYGVTVDGSAVNFGAVFKRKEKVVRKLVAGVKVKMKNAGVEVVPAEATILGRSAEGFDLTAGEAAYSARKLLICSGSEAVVPPIPGLREGLGSTVVTNREILSLTEQPAELVIIGGGVIGMEFASFFNSVGTKVTVVEMLPKILGPMDDEISAMLQAQYQKKGVVFQLGCKVVAVEGDTVVYEDPDGQTCRVRGDRILVSVGRRAGLQGFGLENLGVELALNPAGRPCGIKVDDRMRTLKDYASIADKISTALSKADAIETYKELADVSAVARVELTNSSDVDTDEVIQIYVKSDSRYETENGKLAAYKRVHIKGGETKAFDIDIPARAWTVVNDEGIRMIDADKANVTISLNGLNKCSANDNGAGFVELEVSR